MNQCLVIMIFLCNILLLPTDGASADPPKSVTGESELYQLTFTAEELQWLKEHPQIILSVDDGYKPKNFRNEQGEMIGISIDYVRLLEKYIGAQIKFEGSSWNEALGKAMRHEVDGIINADELEERKPYLAFTNVYAIYPQGLLTRSDEHAIGSLHEFNNRNVAVKRNTSQYAYIHDNYPAIKVVEIDRLDEGIKLLFAKEVDGIYDDISVLYEKTSSLYLKNIKFSFVNYAPPVGHSRIGIRKSSPLLLSIFNKAIAKITEDDHREIQKKWLNIEMPKAHTAKKHPPITLTTEEKKWLEENPVILVGCDPQWAPIEYMDSEGVYHGISLDYLKVIEKMLPVTFKIVKEPSWSKLLEKAKKGQVDLFTNISITPERETFLSFTDVYTSFPVVIYTRNEVPYVGDIKELRGRKIAVGENYAIEGWLKYDYPQLDLVPCATVGDGLSKLSKGEVFAYIGNLVTTGYYISQRGNVNIKVAGDTKYSYDGRMASHIDSPILRDIIQKALDVISEEEKSAIYNKWISIKYEHRFDYSLLWKVGAVVISVFFFIGWSNWHLRRVVTQRTKELVQVNLELEKSEQHYRTLFESANDMIFVIKDEYFVNCNRKAYEVLEFSSEEDLIGKTPGDISPEIQADGQLSFEKARKVIGAALEGEPQVYEWQYMKNSGKLLDVEVSLTSFVVEKERVIIAIVRDLTERKRAGYERENLLKILAAKNEELESILYAGAHDLKSPIVNLVGFSKELSILCRDLEKMLESKEITEDKEILSVIKDQIPEALNFIVGNSNKIDSLLSSVLKVSRISRQDLNIEALDMNELVEQAVQSMAYQITNKDISFETTQLPKCFGDRTQIERVFTNLIDNAYKYLDPGRKGRIKISGRIEGSEAVYCVEDNGIGIAPNHQKKIFELFHRLEPTKQLEGEGIGLTIVRRILQQQNGNIWLESEIGKGSRFYVMLPAFQKSESTCTDECFSSHEEVML